MIINNPLIRLVLEVMSACGLMDSRRDSATRHSNRAEQQDSPFVLVGRVLDGRWGVFQKDFDNPRALFHKLHEACDYANELARTRSDSMVLIRKGREIAAHRGSSIVEGSI